MNSSRLTGSERQIRSTRAFSSELGPGPREENASKQESRASVPIQSETE